MYVAWYWCSGPFRDMCCLGDHETGHDQTMFRAVREGTGAFLAALVRLGDLLEALVKIQGTRTPEALLEAFEARLGALERSRAVWESEVEANLNRAESERRTARAAEERARVKEQRAEALASGDGGMEDLPEEYRDLIRSADAEGSEERTMQPLRSRVGSSREARKAHVRRYKFGG